MQRIDEAYILKMAGFEIDCNDGKGEPSACHHAGEFYATVNGEHKRAAEIYKNNCENNKYGPSCFNLGRYHLSGQGVEQNDAKALDYLDRGCKSNLYPACYFQAMLLYDGMLPAGSVVQSKASIELLPASKEAKVPLSAPTVPGSTASSSVQKKSDKPLALKIFEKACLGGESNSCSVLAAEYLKPGNPQRNPVKAMEHLRRACEGNHAPSCYNLAIMFKKGDTGVQPDPELFEKFKVRTEELVEMAKGQLTGVRTN
eukprot:gene15894-18155_t